MIYLTQAEMIPSTSPVGSRTTPLAGGVRDRRRRRSSRPTSAKGCLYGRLVPTLCPITDNNDVDPDLKFLC